MIVVLAHGLLCHHWSWNQSFKELVWNGLDLDRFCEVIVQRMKANWKFGATNVLKCPQAPIWKDLVQFGTLLGPLQNALHLRHLYIYIYVRVSRLTFRLILLLFQQGCPPGPYCLDYLVTRTCSSCGVRRANNFYARLLLSLRRRLLQILLRLILRLLLLLLLLQLLLQLRVLLLLLLPVCLAILPRAPWEKHTTCFAELPTPLEEWAEITRHLRRI